MNNIIVVGQTYDCPDQQQRKVLDAGIGIYRFDPNELYVKYEIVGKPGTWFKQQEHFLRCIGGI